MTKQVIAAVRQECRKRGIRYIRLDTALDEKKVRKIYLNAGFHIVITPSFYTFKPILGSILA